MAIAGKFGDGGTVSAGPDRGAVVLDHAQQDYLEYSVTTRGAIADFAFSLGDKVVRRVNEATAFVTWTVRIHDMPTADDMAGLQFFFATGAVEYQLNVKHLAANGTTILILKDFSIATTEPADMYVDTIRVFVV